MKAELQRIRQRLTDYSFRRLDDGEYTRFTPSAVLLPLFVKDDQLQVLFTKRTQTVKHHKGQISFPGGRRDPEDDSQLDCALRETEEELGIPASSIEVLGRLDEVPVISYYRIMPFVGVLPYPVEFTLSEDEIDRLIIVPLRHFMKPGIHSVTPHEFHNREYPIHFYDTGDDTIWGATGRILTQFLQVCCDYIPPAYQSYLERRAAGRLHP